MGLFSFNNNQQLSVILTAIAQLNKGDYTSVQNIDDNDIIKCQYNLIDNEKIGDSIILLLQFD
jgi:hypothetical protein